MPKFEIPVQYQVEDDPDGKKGENNYLRDLTYNGAKARYKKISKNLNGIMILKIQTNIYCS